tara:strand:- start:2083 stop:2898 length:816 start_codon:yes stop_codon:yes gene_type:complete
MAGSAGAESKKMNNNWEPISKKSHIGIGIKQRPNFLEFGDKPIIPISTFELKAAITCLPVVFAKQGNKFQLVGLFGVQKNSNLFVNSNGEWHLDFLPSILRLGPFALGNIRDGKFIVFLDKNSPQVVSQSDGFRIFTEDGNETEFFRANLEILENIKRSNTFIETIGDLLLEADLMEAFSIKAQNGNDEETSLPKLWRVNIDKFTGLNDETFLKLRKAKALEIIYGHLYSMFCITKLQRMLKIRAQADAQMKNLGDKIFDDGEPPLEFDFS